MSSTHDSNYVSVGEWMFILFVGAIPVIGWIMLIVWAMMGDNQTRKNYFRAILVWIVLVVGVVITLQSMGRLPEIQKKIQSWAHRA
jgi:threonine/homoserine/homoserine lactone efflux protein